MISASRGAAAPSRHRRASSLGEEVVGGFFSDFEAIQTVILRIIVETFVNLHAIEKTQSRGDVASMAWDDVVSMAWDA